MLNKEDKAAFGAVLILWTIGIILNLLIWGGLIWFVFYLADRYFG